MLSFNLYLSVTSDDRYQIYVFLVSLCVVITKLEKNSIRCRHHTGTFVHSPVQPGSGVAALNMSNSGIKKMKVRHS